MSFSAGSPAQDLVTPQGGRLTFSFPAFNSLNNSAFGDRDLYSLLGYFVFSRVSFADYLDYDISGVLDNVAFPVSASVSGLNLTDLSVSSNLDPRFLACSQYQFSPGIVNSPLKFDYVPISYSFVGSASVTFSDGTTQSIPLNCISSSFSFSVKKDTSSNQYLLSSEDFNLSADNASLASENSSITSSSASFSTKNASLVSRKTSLSSVALKLASSNASLSSDNASLSSDEATLSTNETYANMRIGTFSSRSGRVDISASGLGNTFNASSTSGVGTIATPAGAVSSTGAISSRINSIYVYGLTLAISQASLSGFSLSDATASMVQFSLSAGNLSISSGSFSVSAAEFSLPDGNILISDGLLSASNGEFQGNAGQFGLSNGISSFSDSDFAIERQGVINEAPVTIVPAGSDVYVTGFSITGTFNVLKQRFSRPVDLDNLSFSFDSGVRTDHSRDVYYFGFIVNPVITYSDNSGILAHMSATLDGIYYTLRYDLPLTLRHLIIPTAEEVSDVITEAVDDIKENAGGLGQAVEISENSFTTVTNAFKNSTASGIFIPGLTVPISGKQITFWTDFDVGPYLRSDLVQTILGPAVLILKFAITLFMVRQLMNMWEALMSGCSYLGFLKYQEMDSRDAWLESTDELSAYLGH